MKITILNGNPLDSSFDAYISQTQAMLAEKGNQVNHILLRELPLKYCTGCWSCWVKTPGICQSDEASHKLGRAVINSDFVLWAAPLKMGYPSELLKKALDKLVPLIHPYSVVEHFESHHLKRYAKYPRFGLLIEKEATTDDKDLQILTQMFQRTAFNFKSHLYFSLTSATPAAEMVEKIIDPLASPMTLPNTPQPTEGVAIKTPGRLTLFNGSPRGPKGNSNIFLEKIASGFDSESQTFHLANVNATEDHLRAFAEAEAVWIAFPLYTDAMPGIVKHFFEALEPLVGRTNNPPIGFVVQSGFPEGLHSRFIERYLEKLASRLGAPYLGTVIKGNGEGVRVMSDKVNQKLFENLQSVGKQLSKGEEINAKTLASISSPERFPTFLAPLFKWFLRQPVSHAYFDDMLKKNGVFEKRFDQPFIEINS